MVVFCSIGTRKITQKYHYTTRKIKVQKRPFAYIQYQPCTVSNHLAPYRLVLVIGGFILLPLVTS